MHPPPDRYDAADRARWYAEHRDRAWAVLDGLLLAGDAELTEPTYETELLTIADRPVLVIPAGALPAPSAVPRDATRTAGTRR